MARIVVDVLVTKYEMDPSGYLAGAEKVAGATRRIAAMSRIAENAVGGLGAALHHLSSVSGPVSALRDVRNLTSELERAERAAAGLRMKLAGLGTAGPGGFGGVGGYRTLGGGASFFGGTGGGSARVGNMRPPGWKKGPPPIIAPPVSTAAKTAPARTLSGIAKGFGGGLKGVLKGVGSLVSTVAKTAVKAVPSLLGPIGMAISTALSSFDFIGAASDAVQGFTTAMLEAASSIAKLSWEAMNKSGEFDTKAVSMGGVMGSMEKGRQMMEALEQYARKSVFSMDDLAQASKHLIGSGLSVEAYLPVMERFAIASGRLDAEGLESVAQALSQANGGDFAAAIEAMKGAGVTSEDWMGQGIDSAGMDKVSMRPEDFLAALTRISEGRFKEMTEQAEQGDGAALSNTGETLNYVMRSIGDSLNEHFLPLIEKLADHLAQLAEKGVLEVIISEFRSMAQYLGGNEKNLTQCLKDLVVEVVVFAQIVTDVTRGLKRFVDGLGKFSFLIPGMPAIGGMVHSYKALSDKARNRVIQQLEKTKGTSNSRFPETQGTGEGKGASGSATEPKQDPTHPPQLEDSLSTHIGLQQTDYLRQIAQNTKPNLQSYAFGKGVTATDLSEIRRGRTTRNHAIHRLAQAIEELIGDSDSSMRVASEAYNRRQQYGF